MDSQSLPKKDVFISYSAVDKQWAEDACAAIEARQHSCWIAQRDILPGSEWGAAIISGIDACRIMVLIFSKEADSSPQVRREIERGIGKGLVILPFRVEDVKPSGALEYALSNTHWLDGFKSPKQRQLDLLADAVQQLLAGHPSAVFPAVRSAKKSPFKGRTIWLTGIAVVILVAVAVALFVAGGAAKQDTLDQVKDKKELEKPTPEAAKQDLLDQVKEKETPPFVLQVLPRGGLWRFEMRSAGKQGTDVLTGHFRMSDKRADRRVLFQKEKPSSKNFEKPVGTATLEGALVRVDLGGMRGADLAKNLQQFSGKGNISMQTIGEWSGTLVDKDERKWDFKCTRTMD